MAFGADNFPTTTTMDNKPTTSQAAGTTAQAQQIAWESLTLVEDASFEWAAAGDLAAAARMNKAHDLLCQAIDLLHPIR